MIKGCESIGHVIMFFMSKIFKGQKNFQDIQQHYGKGHKDLLIQMKKGKFP